jgi:hypothetical protein
MMKSPELFADHPIRSSCTIFGTVPMRPAHVTSPTLSSKAALKSTPSLRTADWLQEGGSLYATADCTAHWHKVEPVGIRHLHHASRKTRFQAKALLSRTPVEDTLCAAGTALKICSARRATPQHFWSW